MTAKNKKILILAFLTGCVLLSCWFWRSLYTPEIVAVHENGNHSYVLVRHFPVTDKGKVNWWLKNKDSLKEKYGIPKPSSSGYFTIIFWDFGEGYKEEGKYDRLCFDDMTTKVNCIEKEAIFSVDKSRNRGIMFTLYEGGNYRLEDNGEIIKVASD